MLTARVLAAVPIVPVTDLTASLGWYAALGFVPRSDADSHAHQYALLTMGAVELHLRQLGQGEVIPKEHSPAGVYLRVEGVDQVFTQLKQKGSLAFVFEPTNQPWGMREFAVSDPDGTLLRFGQIA